MDQAQVEIIERKIAEDRGRYYRGTAIVKFEYLHFGSQCPRQLNRENVESLKDTFRKEGCLRLEPKHHIPALIDQQVLDLAMKSSGTVSLDILLKNPKAMPPELKMPPNYSLECIHGRHWVEAGKEILPPKDKWWAVDLYLKDASLDLRRSLSEEYSNSINFSDGEIYQMIRYYKLHTDRSTETMFAEMRWWARLKGKQKDLKMFFARKNFTKALDKLLMIPGIWGGLWIGMLHKVLALKCDEELLRYPDHILTVWSAILGKNRALMRVTDQTTVKALQVRAPRYSKEDLATIEPLFRTGELFSAVRSPADRRNIWNNLQQVEGLIPTIESFFEDFKYLAPTARIVSQLFPKKKRITVYEEKGHTVYEEMYRIFSKHSQKDGEVIVQDSDKTSYTRTGNSTEQFEFGYRQVWLYAWRHFPKLIGECPRKENGQPTPVPQEPSKYRWYELASLVNKLGFQSEQINRLTSIDPFMEIARDALLKAQGLDSYEYGEATFEPYQGQIANIVKTATTRATTTRRPTYTKPTLLVDESGEALERRCGHTFENAYRNDQKFLFLDMLYDPVAGEGKGISSFYVRSSVYFAFFGRYIGSSSTNTIPHQERSTPDIDTENNMPPYRLETQSQSQGDRLQDDHPQNIPSINIISPNREQMKTISTSNEMETTQEASNAIVPYRDQQELEEDTEMEVHRIFFKIWENNTLVDQRISTEMDRPQVEHYVRNQIGAGMQATNTNGRILTEKNCYDAVVRDGTKTIIFIPREGFEISRQMVMSAKQSSKRRQVTREEEPDEEEL